MKIRIHNPGLFLLLEFSWCPQIQNCLLAEPFNYERHLIQLLIYFKSWFATKELLEAPYGIGRKHNLSPVVLYENPEHHKRCRTKSDNSGRYQKRHYHFDPTVSKYILYYTFWALEVILIAMNQQLLISIKYSN